MALAKELNQIEAKEEDVTPPCTSWTLTALVDHIVLSHHHYVNENLSLISELADKVAKLHGETNPETIDIQSLWKKIFQELSYHIKQEELLLFPYLKNLDRFSNGELKVLPTTQLRSVRDPVQMMEEEHELINKWMGRIRMLTSDFTPPIRASMAYKMLYAMLHEFEIDLHKHVHLENDILFPKAIRIEDWSKSK